jgi:hypothetical protein
MIIPEQARMLAQHRKDTDRENRMYKFENEYPEIITWLDLSITDLAMRGFDGVELSLKEYVKFRAKIIGYLRDCGYDVNNLDDVTISIRWG